MTYTRRNLVGPYEYTWGTSFFFAGLAGFGLRFDNGDHKIKFISVGGTTSDERIDHYDYQIGMYDNSAIFNSEDDLFGWAKFIDLGSIE